ncbi:uncharacterized protein LOC106477006 [Limulus polyphemus]|uniref:Uncharacterized protein LOC106477006 n=1 Tax=Limulus polyphemus TaxID=6850 RepID=A0ABM1C2I4_LIMPO|nr:uncharacterized protein LOC106477006 [Limulus polyphemus]
MAFMMPVVKGEYEIYPNRSRRGSACSQSRSRRGTQVESSLSCSPESDVEERMAAIVSLEHESKEHNSSHSISGSQSLKSASNTSLDKFHCRLVDKLKKKLRIDSGVNQDDVLNSSSGSGPK